MNSPEARTPTGEIIPVGTADPALAAAALPAVDSADPSIPSGPPDAYAFTVPEGGSPIDPELLAQATPIFKELGLTQASAQRLVDVYNKSTSGIQASLLAQVEKTRTEWRDAVRADPTLGPKLDAVRVEIGRAKDRLPSDVRATFDTAMDFTGAGDHPAVVRAFYEFAKLLNEGTHVPGGAPSIHGQQPGGKAAPPSLAAAMYPNLVTQ